MVAIFSEQQQQLLTSRLRSTFVHISIIISSKHKHQPNNQFDNNANKVCIANKVFRFAAVFWISTAKLVLASCGSKIKSII